MTRYVLKSGELDGIFPGVGIVTAGEPITPYSEDHEEAIKADGRFKVYREPTEPVTPDAKVGGKKTPADGGKE